MTDDLQPKWPESGRKNSNASRSHVAYWREHVRKEFSKGYVPGEYSARIMCRGRRVRFPLKTSNKDAAASKAAEIYTFVLHYGWDSAFEKFKPDQSPEVPKADAASERGPTTTTVGDLIKAARKFSSAREQSFNAYTKAFRKIVAEIMQIPDGQKFQAAGNAEGNAKWKASVDAVILAEVTSARVQEWKSGRLNGASKNASAKRNASVTVNSLIRNAKALVSRKILPFIREEITLPDRMPFDNITLEPSPPLRYQSKIHAPKLLANAESLRDIDVEAYKIFLLAFLCGLRISEIDHLLWAAFDFDNCLLRVQDSEHHRLKSADSAGDLNLDETMVEVFRKLRKDAAGEFVIESEGGKKRTPGSGSYRCQKQIDALKTWLRKQGVKTAKPIHTLRKEIGAIVASEEGIFAASRYLRHSDIVITAAIYADQKKKVIPSIAKLFGSNPAVTDSPPGKLPKN